MHMCCLWLAEKRVGHGLILSRAVRAKLCAMICEVAQQLPGVRETAGTWHTFTPDHTIKATRKSRGGEATTFEDERQPGCCRQLSLSIGHVRHGAESASSRHGPDTRSPQLSNLWLPMLLPAQVGSFPAPPRAMKRRWMSFWPSRENTRCFVKLGDHCKGEQRGRSPFGNGRGKAHHSHSS